MVVISKDDNFAWIAYLFIGFTAFTLLPGIFMYLLELNASAFIKLPLALLASGLTLYAFKKYLGWYVADGAQLSVWRGMHKVGIGWVVSVVYFSAVIVCLSLMGHYAIVGVRFDVESQLSWFSIFLLVGVAEEVMCRGILFRLISDKWNIAVGLVISSLLFGFLHIFNEGGTVWASLALALNSGWMMGIAYAYHRTIWVPIGMHWSWNYLQGCIYGCTVSGEPMGFIPFITPSITGSELLTGGSFGPEASIITVVMGIAISIVYTILYIKKRRRLGADPKLGL